MTTHETIELKPAIELVHDPLIHVSAWLSGYHVRRAGRPIGYLSFRHDGTHVCVCPHGWPEAVSVTSIGVAIQLLQAAQVEPPTVSPSAPEPMPAPGISDAADCVSSLAQVGGMAEPPSSPPPRAGGSSPSGLFVATLLTLMGVLSPNADAGIRERAPEAPCKAARTCPVAKLTEPLQPYRSADAAAIAVLTRLIEHGVEHEWGGAILECHGYYYATEPVTQHLTQHVGYEVWSPKDCRLAGNYHTHPTHATHAILFSDSDTENALTLHVPSYIGVWVDLTVRKFDPECGTGLVHASLPAQQCPDVFHLPLDGRVQRLSPGVVIARIGGPQR